ncbi:hypothetical protein PG989_004229 [Apiospora arundinis]
MGFFRYNTDPEKNQAKLNVSLSASPTLSISDPNAVLLLTVSVSIASTKDKQHSQKPLTICTENGVFEQVERGQDDIDIFARSGFSPLCFAGSESHGSNSISLGHFRMQRHSDSEAEDMRERQYRFLTVPPVEQQDAAGATASITHELDWTRIFKYEEKRTKEDLVPGEKFEINMVSGSIGTDWWCWGDLNGGLKGKKLHIWHEHEGYYGEEKPEKDESWILGEDPMHLDWEDITPGGKATFTIVK